MYRLLFIILFAVSVCLTGCGSSEDEVADVSTTIEQSDTEEQADHITTEEKGSESAKEDTVSADGTTSDITASDETTKGQTAESTTEKTTAKETTKEQTTKEKTTKEQATKEQTTKQQTTAQTTKKEETTASMTAEQRARKILDSMTLEEKVGQMFIARCPESNAKQLADEYHLGGYILFARDFKNKTKEQVINTISGYQQVSEIPMLIGVDEEGGKVNRVSLYAQFRSEPFKSPQQLFLEGGLDLTKSDAREKSRLLKSLGINVNFAPVADVSTDSGDFIYARTFGKDAASTAEYVKSVVSVMNQENMGSVLKHFPGYGNNEDTHTGIAYDNRSYDSFVKSDFVPFEAGIGAGADMVMVAHNIVYCMDSEYPASLSAKVHKVLREELGFTGVIITDELSMAGVQDFAEDDEIAVLAVKAGNDLLCCTNFEEQIDAVIAAVKNGSISEERINESVLRILKLKISLGIL